jgi:hypothetical protein
MLKKIRDHFRRSYELSPTAYYCELGETTILIAASAILTFTVLDPATRIFIPLYFLGSCLGIISTIIRVAPMATILCSWFAIMNLVAMIKLFVLP